MDITYSCPSCEQTVRVEPPDDTAGFACPQCQQQKSQPPGAWQDGRLTRCLICPSQDLFVRKDFSQKLGLAIVAIGLAASCVTWFYHKPLATYCILFATALVDVVLYLLVGNMLTCYHCHAEYRGLADMETYGQFELETHEKHRQQAARLKQAQRSGP